MKTLQLLACATILLFILLLPEKARAQQDMYTELYGMKRVYKLYNNVYLPKLNAFSKKLDRRVESGNSDFSDLINEFNENFKILTHPWYAIENSTKERLYKLIELAKTEEWYLDGLCELEKERCIERLDKFKSVSSNTFPKMLGSPRANKIYETFYAPRIESLRQQTIAMNKSKQKDFSKIVLAIEVEFSEWVIYTPSKESSFELFIDTFELIGLAVRKELLLGERERVKHEKEKMKDDFIKQIITLTTE